MPKSLNEQKPTLPVIYAAYFPVLMAIMLFRLAITLIKPYPIDMAGYAAWSIYLAEHGPSQLYGSSGFHIVYAPFFQYFLWLTGEIRILLKLPYGMVVYLIKLWSVLFEFIGAFLLVRLSDKAGCLKKGMIAAMLYLVNPGVFFNSSIWGQFDSIPATMLLGVVFLFISKRPNTAALLFLIAVLTKPQSGLLLPVVLYFYFKGFKFDVASIKRLVLGLVSGIIIYLAVVMPFYIPTSKAGKIPGFLDPFYWLFDLYFRSLQDYPYATANAFNLWTLLGGQTQADTLPFLGLSYLWWGNILLFLSLAYAFFCLAKGRASLHAVAYFSCMVLFSAFFFMTKMHERYLLPAVIFAMLSAVFDKRHVFSSILMSFCVFFNHLYLYIISFREQYWLARWDETALALAALTLATYALSVYNGYRAFIVKPAGQKLEKKE